MALIIATVSPVLTSHGQIMSFDSIAGVAPLTMVAEIATSWSVALVKTSIALMLVRLQQSRGWTYFLYTVIGVQVLTAVFVTIMHTTRCIPTSISIYITCFPHQLIFLFLLLPELYARHVAC